MSRPNRLNPGRYTTHAPSALIAEDEPHLARALTAMLAKLWPELCIVATATDGVAATQLALAQAPDILFLDIQMPGRNGLEVAEAVADDWPTDRPPPQFVFVTAHDEFAVAAFEKAATDYLLKPVTPERLKLAVARLRDRLAVRPEFAGDGEMAALFRRVQTISTPDNGAVDRIRVIRAGVGNMVRMIPIEDVLCFEAAEKYVNVITASGEALVRMSLRDLLAQIDASGFLQVHRAIVVNERAIVSATRDENGHYSLQVRGIARPLRVSRAFSHLFRPM